MSRRGLRANFPKEHFKPLRVLARYERLGQPFSQAVVSMYRFYGRLDSRRLKQRQLRRFTKAIGAKGA